MHTTSHVVSEACRYWPPALVASGSFCYELQSGPCPITAPIVNPLRPRIPGTQLSTVLLPLHALPLPLPQASIASADPSPSAPLVVYVSKMVAVPRGLVPRAPGEPTHGSHGSAADEEVFLGFGRVFSGVARPGCRVHVLSAAYNPAQVGLHEKYVGGRQRRCAGDRPCTS